MADAWPRSVDRLTGFVDAFFRPVDRLRQSFDALADPVDRPDESVDHPEASVVHPNWHEAGLFGGGKAVLSGILPGTTLWVRVRTAGIKGVMGAWSGPGEDYGGVRRGAAAGGRAKLRLPLRRGPQ